MAYIALLKKRAFQRLQIHIKTITIYFSKFWAMTDFCKIERQITGYYVGIYWLGLSQRLVGVDQG